MSVGQLKRPLRDTNERRDHPRQGTRIIIRYEAAGLPGSGCVVDIGLGGCGIQTSRLHRAGDQVKMWLPLLAGQPPLAVSGKIVAVRQKAPHRWLVGIQFDASEPELLAALKAHITE